jgi:hypothetical protein
VIEVTLYEIAQARRQNLCECAAAQAASSCSLYAIAWRPVDHDEITTIDHAPVDGDEELQARDESDLDRVRLQREQYSCPHCIARSEA